MLDPMPWPYLVTSLEVDVGSDQGATSPTDDLQQCPYTHPDTHWAVCNKQVSTQEKFMTVGSVSRPAALRKNRKAVQSPWLKVNSQLANMFCCNSNTVMSGASSIAKNDW